MDEKYKKIINIPRHVSKRHRQMPVSERAAQFAPFAALTGYDDVIQKEIIRNEAEGESDTIGEEN